MKDKRHKKDPTAVALHVLRNAPAEDGRPRSVPIWPQFSARCPIHNLVASVNEKGSKKCKTLDSRLGNFDSEMRSQETFWRLVRTYCCHEPLKILKALLLLRFEII